MWKLKEEIMKTIFPPHISVHTLFMVIHFFTNTHSPVLTQTYYDLILGKSTTVSVFWLFQVFALKGKDPKSTAALSGSFSKKGKMNWRQ